MYPTLSRLRATSMWLNFFVELTTEFQCLDLEPQTALTFAGFQYHHPSRR